MPAQNHPQYKEELAHCKYTLECVEESLKSTIGKKDRLDKEVESRKKHFNSDNSQDYIDLMVGTLIQGTLDVKLRNLITARSRPYFARIDFREDNKPSTEKFYIGKMSLIRDDNQELVIVDWRAPIANLYYEGRLGRASYDSPDGKIAGQLELKRQFSIDRGNLNEIFDIDITTNDEFLQTCLGANADNRLKEIVSTIQAEQNAIVRADMWKPLIVQGAAGSGKTTIALHRIAYLIYNYEKSFKPENFMIIAPNRLFLNYISDVLPELGVEKVKQTTFEEFAQELIGRKFKLRDANEKLTAFVDQSSTPEQAEYNRLLRQCSELKTSTLFKEIIDTYVKGIEESFIPEEDFKIGNTVLFKYEELNDLFLRQFKMWPIARRLDEMKKSMNNRLKARKNLIINQLHDECDRKIMDLKWDMEDSEERRRLIIEAIDTKNETIARIESYAKQAVKEYISKISRLSPYEYYRELMNSGALLAKAANGRISAELASFTAEYSTNIFKSGYIEIEDLAPMIYLKFLIYGMDEKIPVKHIVIDEAQDFSAFQIYVLKRIVKDSSFTILGDLNQGIHSYRGTRDWNDITDYVFSDRRNDFLVLEQSYRTTVENMAAANSVIGKIKGREPWKSRPVIRHGDKVDLHAAGSNKEILSDIRKKIQKYKAEGFKSIAVICKTMDECKAAYKALLKDIGEISIITGKEDTYKGGIVVVPSYLSKGLEFDVVFISDAGRHRYSEDELDIKLLYVAMTRPLHKLIIYSLGEPSTLLDGI